jgi:hypothetical protein
MSEYLIFFNDDWVTETSDEGWQQRARDVRVVIDEMKAAGVFIFTGGLNNEASVFHVEPRDGKPVFTDGPYVETKEVFGGFAAVDVPDEAAARYWAGKVAVACDWPQEVRIFRTPADIPTPDADRAVATKEN